MSQRPDLRPDRPLVPFPPRAELWCGLHYEFGKPEPAKVSEPSRTALVAPEPVDPEVGEPTSEPPPEVAPTSSLPTGQLRFLVRDHRTGEPLAAQISVRLASEPRAESSRSQPDASGRLLLDLPPGRYVVTVTLSGYRKQTKRVEVEDQSVTILDLALQARSKP